MFMRLSIELMLQASLRSGWNRSARSHLLDDAFIQATYCLDAPDEVQDGMEWYADRDDVKMCGPVPRMVALRETA